MAVNFPNSIDSFVQPSASNTTNNPSHSGQHQDENSAIMALEAKVGANGSAVTTSHDYKLSGVTSSAKALSDANLDTDGTLAANSDTKISSQKAVKTYVDTEVGNGWVTSEAATFVSADGSTGVFNIASDVTGKYSPGMRYKYQQSQALTAYWTFDADSTSQVGSFNGTDTAMTYTAGKFSNAATFNGTTSKIVISDNASLKPTGEFTIGCWFKKTGAGTQKQVWQSYSANTSIAGIQLQIGTNNVLNFVVGKNTGTVFGVDYNNISGTTNVADNAWHYCVISFRNNYGQMYLDGKLESSGYLFTPAYAATNYVRVGCGNDTGTDVRLFDGQIDDLFLINGYALDEKTIKKQYDAQVAQGTGNITVDKYALIKVVGAYAAGVTPITIWGGTDYSLANATISNPYYSTVSQPFGFDRNTAKWSVEVTNTTILTQLNPVQNTWYNLGSLSITIPIGIWNVSYNIGLQSSDNSTVAYAAATLSTANNSSSNALFDSINYSSAVGASSVATLKTIYKERPLSILSKTTYYLNARSTEAATDAIYFNGAISPTIIRATSTLL